MTDEIQQNPKKPQHDGEREESPRMGPPGTTAVPENLEGAPTEDSPAREPTEKVERMQEADRDRNGE